MLKTELRKIYLARQKAISSAERNEKSEKITNVFFENFDLSGIRFLHCFLPIEKFKEIKTKLIFETAWREFPAVKTLVPRVDFRNDEIENLIYTAETALGQNQWQIHEPLHDESVEAAEIDLVIVPLIAVDKKGFRVGYGKGFYDRLLAKCRANCLKVGLSYFAPIEEIADVKDFDAPLDYCVTPEEVWKFERAAK